MLADEVRDKGSMQVLCDCVKHSSIKKDTL